MRSLAAAAVATAGGGGGALDLYWLQSCCPGHAA